VLLDASSLIQMVHLELRPTVRENGWWNLADWKKRLPIFVFGLWEA
jgi:hypothetical protein